MEKRAYIANDIQLVDTSKLGSALLISTSEGIGVMVTTSYPILKKLQNRLEMLLGENQASEKEDGLK